MPAFLYFQPIFSIFYLNFMLFFNIFACFPLFFFFIFLNIFFYLATHTPGSIPIVKPQCPKIEGFPHLNFFGNVYLSIFQQSWVN